jgi:hypothetical protein
MMSVEQSVELRLAWETKVLGENLPQHHFVHDKSHTNWARRGGKPATNRLSYYTAYRSVTRTCYGHVHVTTIFTHCVHPAVEVMISFLTCDKRLKPRSEFALAR